MATLYQIYGVEEAVAAGWQTLLVAELGTGVQVLIPDVDDDTQTDVAKVPRVEVSVEDRGNTEHVRSASGSLCYFDEWKLNVRLKIVTDRVRGNATHKNIRRSCRVVAHTTTRAAFETALVYYQVYHVKGGATSYSVSNENKLDETELSFETVVRVLDTAWP